MPDDEIEKIEDELKRAREDLSASLHQANVKAEGQFDVTSRVKNHPLLALGSSAALGFVLGLSPTTTLPTAAALLGIAIGFSLRRTRRRL